jgi:hypothetical protein
MFHIVLSDGKLIIRETGESAPSIDQLMKSPAHSCEFADICPGNCVISIVDDIEYGVGEEAGLYIIEKVVTEMYESMMLILATRNKELS